MQVLRELEVYTVCIINALQMTSTRALERTSKNEKLKFKICSHHSKFTFGVTDNQSTLWRLKD